MSDLCDRQVRIAGQIIAFQNDMDRGIAVAAHEAVAEGVERQPELPHAGDGGVFSGQGIKAKIPAADRHRLGIGFPLLSGCNYHAAPETIGNINLVVQSERGMVGPELGIFLGEPGEPRLPQIGGTIAILILEISDLSGHRHNDAASPGLNAIGEQQLIGERFGRFVKPIAVIVIEQPDPRARRFAGSGTVRVIRHLDHPQSSVFIEGHRYRVDHLRFRGDKLHLQIGVNDEMLEGFLGRKRPHHLRHVVRRPRHCQREKTSQDETGPEKQTIAIDPSV